MARRFEYSPDRRFVSIRELIYALAVSPQGAMVDPAASWLLDGPIRRVFAYGFLIGKAPVTARRVLKWQIGNTECGNIGVKMAKCRIGGEGAFRRAQPHWFSRWVARRLFRSSVQSAVDWFYDSTIYLDTHRSTGRCAGRPVADLKMIKSQSGKSDWAK